MRYPSILVPAFVLILACAGSDGDRTDASASETVSTVESTGDPDVCAPGMQIACDCPGGASGVQICNATGSGFEPCECGGADESEDDASEASADGSSSSAGDPCGDTVCAEDGTEDCESCPTDCGECIPCTAAPSCDGAEVPPVITMHAENLDDVQMQWVDPARILAMLVDAVDRADPAMRLVVAALADPVPDELAVVSSMRDAFAAHPQAALAVRTQLARAGVTDASAWRAVRPEPRATGALVAATDPLAGGAGGDPCEDPRLRVRIARLDVHEEDDDVANDEVYCAVETEGAEAAELRVTPLTAPLDEGDSVEYSVAEGVIWGQMDLAAPIGSLSITYNCIESDTDNGYVDLLAAISEAAMDQGAMGGENGWIFDTAGIVAGILSGALALDGDDQLFNASQIVPEDQHVALTQGAYWVVRRSGTHLNSDWDWELRVEIWGCHDQAC